MEEWKPCPDWSKYEVSSHGRIRRVSTQKVRAQFQTKNGYCYVVLTDGPKRKHVAIHQAVAKAFVPCPKSDRPLEPNHKNNNRTDNRAENLEWLTRSENLKHAYAKGKANAKGSRNNRWSKLTEADIPEIRAATTDQYPEIMARFGIAFETIRSIKYRKSWKHV